jgi:hypothetical protein
LGEPGLHNIARLIAAPINISAAPINISAAPGPLSCTRQVNLASAAEIVTELRSSDSGHACKRRSQPLHYARLALTTEPLVSAALCPEWQKGCLKRVPPGVNLSVLGLLSWLRLRLLLALATILLHRLFEKLLTYTCDVDIATKLSSAKALPKSST